MELGRCSLADQMETGLYKGNRQNEGSGARVPAIWLAHEHLHENQVAGARERRPTSPCTRTTSSWPGARRSGRVT